MSFQSITSNAVTPLAQSDFTEWGKARRAEVLFARFSRYLVRALILAQTAALFYLARFTEKTTHSSEWQLQMLALIGGIMFTTFLPAIFRWIYQKQCGSTLVSEDACGVSWV